MIALFSQRIGRTARTGESSVASQLQAKTSYVRRSFGFQHLHDHDDISGNVHPDVPGCDRRRVGGLPAPSLGSPQGSRGYSLDIVSKALLVSLMLGAFLHPHAARAYDLILDYSTATASWTGHSIDLGNNGTTHSDHNVVSTLWVPKYAVTVCSYSFYLNRTSQGGTGNVFTFAGEIYTGSGPQTGTKIAGASGGAIYMPQVTFASDEAGGTIHEVTFTPESCIEMSPGQSYFFNLIYVAHTGGSSPTSGLWNYQYAVYDFSYYTDQWVKYGDTGWTEATANENRTRMYGYGSGIIPGDPTYETGNPGWAVPSSASSGFSLTGAGSFCSGLASSSFAFGIPYGLCYISGYLFIPSDDAVNQFISQAALVQGKIPWSYVLEVKGLFDNAASTSQTIPVISIPWTVFNASSSLTLVSSASFYRWVSSSTWNTVRGLTTAALWFSFGWYAWRRGRHFFKTLK